MVKKTVSKCGARLNNPEKKEGVIRTLSNEEEESIFGKYKKDTTQKKTVKNKSEKIYQEAPAVVSSDDVNSENEIGVSDSTI